ncbi:hypothetical protein [Reichenbachiella sp. MALMAid0571]|uniref:hypothetical protein n=1 Tax=Reichenbachiella sp. MALMAid0571 TaxID=3143939 RepID=UPI0032DE4E57
MTLQEANNLFERLKSETTKKSEIKIYEKFLHILRELKIREFSKNEIQSIETKLDSLNLESGHENDIKFFKKAIRDFEKFLKDNLSLTSKGYYTNLGIALGTSFGVLLGVVVLSNFERSLGISLGIAIGLLIGLFTGRDLDARALTEGKVY